MSTPWEILGLNPDDVDMRSLRRTYAGLIKVHRPDQDPEAFRQIHEAYEKVFRWLKIRAERGDALAACYFPGPEGENASKVWLSILNDDIAAESGAAAGRHSGAETAEAGDEADHPGQNLGAEEDLEASAEDEDFEKEDLASYVAADTPLVEAALELEAARERGDANAIRESIRKVTDQWRAHLEHTAVWVAILEAQMDEDPKAVAEVLGSDELLCEIQQGSYHTACGVLPVWAAGGWWEKIRTVGVELIKEENRLPMPAGAFVMVCWARVSAIIFPKHALKLADLAYRNLTPDTRELAFSDVDVALVMGREMEGMPLSHRKTIVRCMTANQADVCDLDTVAAMSELYFREGAKLSKQQVFRRFPNFRRLARQGPLGRKRRMALAARSKSRWTAGWWWGAWPIWIGVLLLIRLLFVFGSGPSSPAAPRPQPPPPAFVDDADPLLDEYGRMRDQPIIPGSGEGPSPGEGAEPYESYLENRKYLEHPWLLDVRERMRFRTTEDLNEGGRLIRGEGEIKRDSPQYRIMLKAFIEDDSLPSWARALARQEWDSLPQPKDMDEPPKEKTSTPPAEGNPRPQP